MMAGIVTLLLDFQLLQKCHTKRRHIINLAAITMLDKPM
jgi:hypothetical protein